MNFLPGQIRAEPDGRTWFTFGSQKIALPPAVHKTAAHHAGKELILGVRPEGLSPGQPSMEGKFAWPDNSFDAKVNVLEPLGDRVDVSLSGNGQDQLVCRADAHQFGNLPVGGIIKVFMDLGRVHLFEPGDNGVNVTLTRESSHAAA
jgi:hypothetical protein